ncbi:Hypothetical protein NTJ_10339 [Nesidiocoris tenuis]|uniref:Uncharacterized protein n=1 Tax=Nesidiocoris tenuis TaxID=355587 RepID=A0ABN7AZC7_9HEMI|nr:Hypothetical protein NTJ_10339 [Nesidiocoris tenuis]
MGKEGATCKQREGFLHFCFCRGNTAQNGRRTPMMSRFSRKQPAAAGGRREERILASRSGGGGLGGRLGWGTPLGWAPPSSRYPLLSRI